MMKLSCFVLVLSFVLSSVCAGEAVKPAEMKPAISAPAPYFDVSVGVRDKFIEGIGTEQSPDPIAVTDVRLSFPKVKFFDFEIGDAYAGILVDTGLNPNTRYGSTFADKVEPYIGLSREIKHTVRLNVSFTYFALKDLAESKDDALVPEARLDIIKMPFITPYVKVRRFDGVGDNNALRRWFGSVGVTRAQKIWEIASIKQNIMLNLDFSLASSSRDMLGRTSGAKFVNLAANIKFPVTKHFSIVPSIRSLISLEDLDDKSVRHYTRKDTEEVFGIDLKFHW